MTIPTPSVLLLSHDEADHRALGGMFGQSAWKLHAARSSEEAWRLLRESSIDVVLVDSRAAWADLLADLQVLGRHPPLIVTSSSDDPALWAEVLNTGGYDLLLKPFDSNEVFRVVSIAWRMQACRD